MKMNPCISYLYETQRYHRFILAHASLDFKWPYWALF